jgi:dipeptidyl aminopeptidase/acylaminoacyl peptidase
VKGPQGWDVAVDDIMSGVDEVIRKGYADPERMGLMGFSNGGGIVDYLVTATDRFKAAVSVAPVIPDWLTLFYTYTMSDAPAFAGTNKTPWDDLDGYVKLSAVYHLPNVKTPMLLAVGDEDRHFLLGILEMYNGLRWLGKDVTLLRYPGQGHGFSGASMKDFWQRETAFFDKYLKPAQ